MPILTPDKGLERIASRKYDVIIAGGGLAGLVLANRLSEDASKSILVVEAGDAGLGDPRIDTPGLMTTLWEDPRYDWGLWSVPQKGMNGREIPQPRGKVLGGSSATNVAAIVFPAKRNFDNWSALGNSSWSAETMAPYLRKFHTFYAASVHTRGLLGLDSYIDEAAQGDEGPLSVSYSDQCSPFHEAWQRTFAELGLNDHLDPIHGRKLGAFTPASSIDPMTKTRSYSASAYLDEEVQQRPNLDVLIKTTVTSVLFHDKWRTMPVTRGLTITTETNGCADVEAGQVILCAGALKTPQILELSGIGCSKIMNALDIPVVVDNPGVGENLQDHCLAYVSYEIAEGQASADVLRDTKVLEGVLQEYQTSRTGPLTGSPLSLAYLPAGDDAAGGEVGSMKQLLEAHVSQDTAPRFAAQYELLRDMAQDTNESMCFMGFLPAQTHMSRRTSMSMLTKPSLPENYISLGVGLNHPFSRGSVHARSKDPGENPEIDPKYLSHGADLEMLAHGIAMIEKVVHTHPFMALLKPESRIPSGPSLKDLNYAREIATSRSFTMYHVAGSCAMMARELGGVVDEKLDVYGVKNLKVVDASIFPMMTMGNIQATVYAVAERAADIIRDSWEGI